MTLGNGSTWQYCKIPRTQVRDGGKGAEREERPALTSVQLLCPVSRTLGAVSSSQGPAASPLLKITSRVRLLQPYGL